MSIYQFSATTITGESVSLEQFKNQVLLIVNTASRCGFTPQYEGLQQLYATLGDEGLTVLGFPCNQFAQQESGTNEDIKSFCDLKFGVTFPMFAKIEVNGDSADPLYKYLKKEAPGIFGTEAVKWNFTKFLVDRSGRVVKRYSPSDAPQAIAADIKALL
jgi:glutathione peroxidase